MRQSASLALNLYGAGTANPFRPLQQADAGHLASFLLGEAVQYYYSASVSLCDALNGISSGYYGWATVKCYYAAFYCVSALLARNGICLYHDGHKPRYLRARPGSQPVKVKGNTHIAAWQIFVQEFPNNPLLMPIDGRLSFEWLRALREEANYVNASFWEPEVPAHFAWLDDAGITRCITAYVGDAQAQYAFDKDHAAIAFPLECLRHTFQSIGGTASGFTDGQKGFLAECRRTCGGTQALAQLVLA